MTGREKICLRIEGDGSWFSPGSGWYNGVSFYNNRYSHGSCSGSGTVKPPIEPVTCSLDNIIIEHGNIDITNVNNAKAISQVKIRCLRKTTVRTSFPNKGKISLSNDMLHSVISVDGVAGGGEPVVVDKEKELIFSSELHYAGGALSSGEYQGSTVVTLHID